MDVSELGDAENADLRGASDRLLEVYAPVHHDDGTGTVAAVEFYQRLDEYLPLFPGRYWEVGGDEYLTPAAQPLYPQLLAYAKAHYGPAATVNDLKGFGSKVLETVLEVSGAASAVLYLPDRDGSFAPAESVGGSPGSDDGVGREEARRAAVEKKSIFLSVGPRTPTINVFDGRILPRESVHVPLVYFDHVVGVLALGAARPFTTNARNVISAIAPSLAVAVANAAANERVAEQTRRLAEQNELLEDQRSRIARAREIHR